MAENLIGSDVAVQVAIVVKDIEAKSAAWAKVLGVDVPKWSLTDGPEKSHIQYMSGPTEARAKLAFFQLGHVSLELIEPVGRPSTWGQFLDEKGEGLHHIAFNVKGMDGVITRLAANDISLVQRGDYTGGCYAYMDSSANLGAILELLENFK